EHRAYGVFGLNDRIRDIVGGTGVIIETGLVQYGGRFVCDGLVSRILWLGKNYRHGFNRAYQAIRLEGRFYSRYGPKISPGFSGGQLIPFDASCCRYLASYERGERWQPSSNSIFLFFPGHGGEPVETFYKTVKIEGFILFQHVKNLRRDDTADQSLCLFFGMTGFNETFEGLSRLRRIIIAELVFYHFHDCALQMRIAF